MWLYVAGTVLGTVGACYAAIKLFSPWLLADFRYIRKIVPLVKHYESYGKRGIFFVDVFEEMAQKIPDKACILYQDEQYTYKEVNDRANQVARAGLGLGLKKGDTVAMMMYNEPAFLWTYLGMLKIGVATSLINTNLRGKPLQHSITVSSTNIIIVGPDKDLQEAVLAVLPEFPDMAVYTNYIQIGSLPAGFSTQLHDNAGTMATDNTDSALRAGTKASDPAVYIFTSGTTGLPKAATVSMQKYLSGMLLGGLFGFKSTDRVLTCLPLYHSNALMVGFAATIMFGATVVLDRKYSKSRYLDTCRKHHVTVITYIGEMCRYLLTNEKSEADRDHSIRLAIGNGMRADIFQEFKDRFAIPHMGEFYSSTEGSMGLVNLDEVPGACGRLSPFLRKILPSGLYQWDVENECLVRDDKGHCLQVPIGTPGLLLTAINKTQAYYGYKGRKDLIESKIVRNVDKDGDCFYNTGDLMVQDKNYSSYFSDRIGDTFRWKGENVSTTEVSNCLSELNFIIDACVYGVIIPGHDGRAGMATLLVNQAMYRDVTAADNLQTFHQHCKDTLPSYARPMFLRICFDDLDMTSTLKQNKVRLKKEGFDVKVIKEDVCYFDKSSDSYKPLTEKVDINGLVF